MHGQNDGGIPIGKGVTLVIAKKMAAGPGGYADFGNNPPCPAEDLADAAPDAEDPPLCSKVTRRMRISVRNAS